MGIDKESKKINMNIVDNTKEKMKAAVDHLRQELKTIRTGRANVGMLDPVMVELYGTPMRLRDVASITAPESRMLLVTPFDVNQTAALAKAIQRADLGGLTAIADGNSIRIMVAQMDASMRKTMVKTCYKFLEDAKVSVRNIRREANDTVRKQKGEGTIPEDFAKKQEKNIQELTDKFCKECDDVCAEKEKEISTI